MFVNNRLNVLLTCIFSLLIWLSFDSFKNTFKLVSLTYQEPRSVFILFENVCMILHFSFVYKCRFLYDMFALSEHTLFNVRNLSEILKYV